MFRTSPVHHQECFVQAVFADLVSGNTRTSRHVQPLCTKIKFKMKIVILTFKKKKNLPNVLFQVQTCTAITTLHVSAVEEIFVILKHGDPIGTPPAVSLWTTFSALLLHSIISVILDWPELACTDFHKQALLYWVWKIGVRIAFVSLSEWIRILHERFAAATNSNKVKAHDRGTLALCLPVFSHTPTSHTRIMSRIRVHVVEDNGY